LSTYSDKKSAAIPQQLYKPASRGLSAAGTARFVSDSWASC